MPKKTRKKTYLTKEIPKKKEKQKFLKINRIYS